MLNQIKQTLSTFARSFWRWLRRYPILRGTAITLLHPALPTLRKFLSRSDSVTYSEWVQIEENRNRLEVDKASLVIQNLHHLPLMSVVMPCYETPPHFLREAIASVQAQRYPHWELCIVDDASPSNQILQIVSEFANNDSRIRVQRRQENGHISAASNTALEMARGEWVVLMDHDDLLAVTALLELATEINKHPDSQIIYSDEDHIDARKNRSNPYFKPDFDPDLLLGQNMVSHLGAYRRDLIVSIGGFRNGFEGSQDHDLVLRASTACTPDTVRHIPSILYHWRQQAGPASFSEKSLEKCVLASRRAVTEHLNNRGINASVSPAPLAANSHRIQFPVPTPAPKVSIVIPMRDRAYLLEGCIEGLLNRTDYQNFEILIADNGSIEEASKQLFRKLERWPKIKILSLPGPFNYSRLNNQAVLEATGDVLLLLNNDTDVIGSGWLTEMVSHAIRPEIGAVGAKLLYKNNTVQHAGVILGIGWPESVAVHYAVGAPRDEPGLHDSLALLRSVSAVTGACLAVRRDLYNAVGGLDETNLAVAFSDVDFCLRLRGQGYRNVWTPFAELYHYESISRGDDLRGKNFARFQKEVAYMCERWGGTLGEDPYWNPHLSLNSAFREIAKQSRRRDFWEGFLPSEAAPDP
jgi:GT2 family glycosyltransferase